MRFIHSRIRAFSNLILTGLAAVSVLAGCADNTGGARADAPATPATPALAGHLLLIGGSLYNDNADVYQRFITLASPGGQVPRILIATAASGDEAASSQSKVVTIRRYSPAATIDIIGRETPPDLAVSLIDRATGMFFTGGDQKRIVTAYRPEPPGVDGPEAAAMRRLLARGGVIAGTSAGEAMMSDPMFLTGRSAEALGIRSPRTQPADDDDPDERRALPPLGPQNGLGMGFLPWAIADSHFFERDRLGRLVAALEASGKRLGIGVGENACVEVDLGTGELIGISEAGSLLVDAGSLERDGLTRRGVRANVVRRGMRLPLAELATARPSSLTYPPPPSTIEEVALTEPGHRRRTASWRFFTRVEAADGPARLLRLDGYEQLGWSDGVGGSIIEIRPSPR